MSGANVETTNPRFERALMQKMMLYGARCIGETTASFDVSGTAGNLYRVTCNCVPLLVNAINSSAGESEPPNESNAINTTTTTTFTPVADVASATLAISAPGVTNANTSIATGQIVWDCTCPDFLARGIKCKHAFFVQVRVCKDRCPFAEARRLYQIEDDQAVEETSPGGLIAPKQWRENCAVVLAQRFPEQYALSSVASDDDAHVGNITTSIAPTNTNDRRYSPGAECGICIEPMYEDRESLLCCDAGCKNVVHASCFAKWEVVRGSTCVYCRAFMRSPQANATNAAPSYHLINSATSTYLPNRTSLFVVTSVSDTM